MSPPPAAPRWWAPREPGWVRNTVIAGALGVAIGLIVLLFVVPLAPGGSPAAAPSAADSTAPPAGGLQTIILPGPSLPAGPSPSARPSTSPSASPSASVAPSPPGPAPLTARYVTTGTWDGGYTAEITITAVRAVNGWTAVLTLPPGVDVSTSWEASYAQSGRTVTFTPTAPNRNLPAGESVTIGFQVSGSGRATACAVNGVPCTFA